MMLSLEPTVTNRGSMTVVMTSYSPYYCYHHLEVNARGITDIGRR